MDSNSVMTAGVAALVIVALVDALRTKIPSIDGLVVLAVSTVAGVGLSFLMALTDGGTLHVALAIEKGIMIGLTASGGMRALAYHAEKSSTTVVTPVEVNRSKERGFSDFDVLLCMIVVAAVAIGCAAACPLIHVADDACPYVVVLFEDGHKETFLKKDVVAGARFAARAKGMHAEPVCP